MNNILPYIRLVLRDEYEPARWRSDLFWSSPATLSSVAEYGDLTEDETAEIGEIITEWAKSEKGSERFQALSDKDKRNFIQDVLVPEAAVGLVLASLGEESWRGATANGHTAAVTDSELQLNGTAKEAKDAASAQPDTAKPDETKEGASAPEANEPSVTAPTAEDETSEQPASSANDEAAVQPAADAPVDLPTQATDDAATTDAVVPAAPTDAQPEQVAEGEAPAPTAEAAAEAAADAIVTDEPVHAGGGADAATAPTADTNKAVPATETPAATEKKDPEAEAEQAVPEPSAAPAEEAAPPGAAADALPANGDAPASETMDVDPPAAPADPTPAVPDAADSSVKSDQGSAYAAARAQLADLRAAAAHKQWAMRQTEVLRARRERRAALKLPSELETREDRAEAGVAAGTLGRSARGRVRRKVNYKDP